MIEKITKLIYLYSIKRKIVDIDFIKIIINTYAYENDIEGFLERITFTDKINKYMADYNVQKKEISINRNDIFNNAVKLFASENIQETEYERILKINLYITKIIFHELGHISQYKTVYSNNNSFEKELYELSLYSNLMIINNKYTVDTVPKDVAKYINLSSINYNNNQFYISLPTERMTEINALRFCKEIALNLDENKSQKVSAYESIKYILFQLKAYGEYAPTAYIIYKDNLAKKEAGLKYGSTNINKISTSLEKIAIKNNYSLEEKLYYGLPISQNEKNLVKKK